MPLDVERCAAFLAAEGYRPAIDGDRFVTFKHEGGFYYVHLDPEDPNYVRVVYPSFWRLAGQLDVQRAMAAANNATQSIKAAKVTVLPDESKVSASVELFIQAPEQFEAVLPMCLSALQAAVATFVREVRARTVDPAPPDLLVRRFGEWPKPN